MICPTCGAAATHVIETRRAAFNTTARRRECPLGHRFSTREIHEPVFCSAKQRAKVFAETLAKRFAIRQRDMGIAKSLHAGWREIAARFGLDKSAVYLAAARGRKYLKESDHEQRQS